MLLFRRRRVRAHAAVREATKAGVTVLDRRLPLAESAKVLLRKAFPDHWSFLLGEIALYSFVVLVLTGTWLTLFFEPGTRETLYQGSYVPLDGLPVSAAYDSTLHISFEVRGGLLVRQMHHWGALVFLAAISVHLLRIFFTGAFRRPREFNWMIGVLLFLLALLEGSAATRCPTTCCRVPVCGPPTPSSCRSLSWELIWPSSCGAGHFPATFSTSGCTSCTSSSCPGR